MRAFSRRPIRCQRTDVPRATRDSWTYDLPA
jgi:hypothetical protein